MCVCVCVCEKSTIYPMLVETFKRPDILDFSRAPVSIRHCSTKVLSPQRLLRSALMQFSWTCMETRVYSIQTTLVGVRMLSTMLLMPEPCVAPPVGIRVNMPTMVFVTNLLTAAPAQIQQTVRPRARILASGPLTACVTTLKVTAP